MNQGSYNPALDHIWLIYILWIFYLCWFCINIYIDMKSDKLQAFIKSINESNLDQISPMTASWENCVYHEELHNSTDKQKIQKIFYQKAVRLTAMDLMSIQLSMKKTNGIKMSP